MLLLLALACDPPAPPPPPAPERPDLLLITIDTLRADRVGAYGDPLAKTPGLDALAAEGALFREAHSVTPLTLPSHATLLTGLLPARHGLRDNGGFRLDPAVPTLAEALAAAGYATGAFVGAYVLDGAWGLDRGFQTYRDPFHPQEVGQAGAFGELELPSAEVVNAARAWWRSQEGKPRFAWVHVYDPHAPWTPHPGGPEDPYRSEVSFADGLLRPLLEDAGQSAVIVVTSDHGEGLWGGGEREHGVLLGRHVTRVPLIIRPPGGLSGSETPAPRTGLSRYDRPAGVDPALDLRPVPDAPRAARVVEPPVGGVDVAPTLADYAGVALPGVDGRSLRPAVEGQALDSRPVVAETWYPAFHLGLSPLFMAQDATLRAERGLWTRAWAWADDPDGPAGAGGDSGPLTALLPDPTAPWPRPGPLDPQAAAALEALGYLTAAPAAAAALADPRDQIGRLRDQHAAEALPDPADRARALGELVGRHPEQLDAWISLAVARAAAGDLPGARAATAEALARAPEHPTALANAAALALEAGALDEAVAQARRLRALNPADPRSHRIEAAAHVRRGDAAAVLQAGRAGLEVAPDDPNLHYLVALAEIEGGDPKAAVPHLLAARKAGSVARDIELWLAVAHDRAGEIDVARRHYEEASRQNPDDLRAWAMGSWMLYQAGRCPEAWPWLVNLQKRGAARDPKVAEALTACEPQARRR